MAFGTDSIKPTPNVTYDLSLFVVKNTDSIQIHRDVTVHTVHTVAQQVKENLQFLG